MKPRLILSNLHYYDWPWTPEEGSAAYERMEAEKSPTIAEVLEAGGFSHPTFDLDTFKIADMLPKQGKIHWAGSEHCGVVSNYDRRRLATGRILEGDQFDTFKPADLCSVCLEDFNNA
jgi:hypothetical protein